MISWVKCQNCDSISVSHYDMSLPRALDLATSTIKVQACTISYYNRETSTKFMSSKDGIKIATIIMTVFSFHFVLVLLITSVATDTQRNISAKNFKDFVTNMIKEQSTKIQTLLKKIQTNAQTVLQKMENVQEKKMSRKKLVNIFKNNEVGQVESPLKTNFKIEPYSKQTKESESRSFSSHYGATSYGASGNANYGTPTYHHHSIGFDPINIVVSVSLLSFLIQALQGLLTRTRSPTPVVEARAMNAIEDWTKHFENKLAKDKFYIKKKYLKKYYS